VVPDAAPPPAWSWTRNACSSALSCWVGSLELTVPAVAELLAGVADVPVVLDVEVACALELAVVPLVVGHHGDWVTLVIDMG
jgi:hypothetical protein